MAPGLGDDRGFEVFGTHSASLFLGFTGCLGRNACITIDFDYVARKEPCGVVDVQVGGL